MLDASLTSIEPVIILDPAIDDPLQTLSPLVLQAVDAAETQLAIAAAGDFNGLLVQAFGESVDPTVASQLQSAFLARAYIWPTVAVVPAADLQGGLGAYGAATQTIYLSESLVQGSAASSEALAAVLLEELGHYLNEQVTPGIESDGDEGAIFSAAVRGVPLSAAQLTALRGENDRATLFLLGQVVAVERATLTVDDDSNGDYTTLADAIVAANDGDTIIVTGGNDNIHNESNILINKSLTIQGDGNATIDADNLGRVFNVDDESYLSVLEVTIDGLTITGGNISRGSGGGIRNNGENLTVTNSVITGNNAFQGGGIYTTSYYGGSLTVTDSTISGNTAGGNGGGLAVVGGSSNVSVTNSTIQNNQAYQGGGVFVDGGEGGASLTITDSTISDNVADGSGGGIYSRSNTEISNSTLSGNTAGGVGGALSISGDANLTMTGSTVSNNVAAGNGGGIDINQAPYLGDYVAEVVNSTISGNTAGVGGGGFSLGTNSTLLLYNSTVTLNTATNGGGISNIFGGAVTSGSSIIAGNTNNDDITGEGFSSAGNNLIGNGDGVSGFVNGTNGDQVGTAADPIDPLLGPLQNNGGPTQTHALLPDSPAIDAGSNLLGLRTDQRGAGFDRVVGTQTDVGAYELQVVQDIDIAIDKNFLDLDSFVFGDPNVSLDATKVIAPVQGSTVTFELVVTNNGTTAANQVRIQDLLDDRLLLQSIAIDSGTLIANDSSGQTIDLLLSLAAGETRTITVTTTVNFASTQLQALPLSITFGDDNPDLLEYHNRTLNGAVYVSNTDFDKVAGETAITFNPFLEVSNTAIATVLDAGAVDTNPDNNADTDDFSFLRVLLEGTLNDEVTPITVASLGPVTFNVDPLTSFSGRVRQNSEWLGDGDIGQIDANLYWNVSDLDLTAFSATDSNVDANAAYDEFIALVDAGTYGIGQFSDSNPKPPFDPSTITLTRLFDEGDDQPVAAVQQTDVAAAEVLSKDDVSFGPITIDGFAFLDGNGNGTQDIGEAGQAGVVVNLYVDTNNNGIAEPDGGDAFIAAATTGANGEFAFGPALPVTPGNYFVQYERPAGLSFNPLSNVNAQGLSTVFNFEFLETSQMQTVNAGLLPVNVINGNNFPNFLLGQRNQVNQINGLGGNDTIFGKDLTDFINGGSGNDWLFGEGGDDQILGEAGQDFICGGDGSDLIDGGLDADTLFGWGGADFFVLRPGDGNDTIYDYQDGVDKFLLAGGLMPAQIQAVSQPGFFGQSTQLRVMDTQEVLATLIGVNASVIDPGDFVTV
jgi:Ca2+-binding RTX toxin-like protein